MIALYGTNEHPPIYGSTLKAVIALAGAKYPWADFDQNKIPSWEQFVEGNPEMICASRGTGSEASTTMASATLPADRDGRDDRIRRAAVTFSQLVWGSLWGSLTSKRADFGGLGRTTGSNEKEPKALN